MMPQPMSAMAMNYRAAFSTRIAGVAEGGILPCGREEMQWGPLAFQSPSSLSDLDSTY